MQVLLVHGLGRTPLSMRSLGRRLRRRGHRPVYFGYAAPGSRYEEIVTRLTRVVERLDAHGAIWVAIGHSLGGLLLRAAIANAAPRHLAHLIMLGTPNHPPRLAGHAAAFRVFRWLAGECGQRLASPEFFAQLPALTVPYTVLAGVRGLHGRFSPFADESNDGIVALSEARARPDDVVQTFPATHTFLMNHPAVQDAVLRIIKATAARRY